MGSIVLRKTPVAPILTVARFLILVFGLFAEVQGFDELIVRVIVKGAVLESELLF